MSLTLSFESSETKTAFIKNAFIEKFFLKKYFLQRNLWILNFVMKIALKSFQQNLIAINMTEIKNMRQEMLTPLLQYHIILHKKI